MAQATCPANAHVVNVDLSGNVRTTTCHCDSGYKNSGGVCAPVAALSSECLDLKDKIDSIDEAASRASLAQDVYSFFDQTTQGWLMPSWKAPPGYTLLSNNIDALRDILPHTQDSGIKALIAPDNSGYRAAIYKDDAKGTIFLVFRGTNDAADWTQANRPNEEHQWTAYYAHAGILGEMVKRYADANGLQMEIVGHSLGGGMAIEAGITAKVRTTVFNAETVHATGIVTQDDIAGADQWVTDYVTRDEPVTTAQSLILSPAPGKRVDLPDWPGSPKTISTSPVAATVERHRMRSVRLAIQNQSDILRKQYAAEECTP